MFSGGHGTLNKTDQPVRWYEHVSYLVPATGSVPQSRRAAARRQRTVGRSMTRLGADLPRPAHRHSGDLRALGGGAADHRSTIASTPLTYDFWGFPERYYRTT